MMIARSLTLLLCLCALALRMSGIHAHVALNHEDVQQHAHLIAPGLHHELHLDHETSGHDGVLHDEAAGDPYQHIEISLDNQALSKKPGADFGIDTLVFLATLLCLLLASRKLILPLTRPIAPQLQRLIHLRPPLRGPPLHA